LTAQIVSCAELHFSLVSSSNGRLDYVETIKQWRARFSAPSFNESLLKLCLANLRSRRRALRDHRGTLFQTRIAPARPSICADGVRTPSGVVDQFG